MKATVKFYEKSKAQKFHTKKQEKCEKVSLGKVNKKVIDTRVFGNGYTTAANSRTNIGS